MKNQLVLLILISSSLIANNIYSQKIKIQNYSFKYEILPQRPLPNTYKTYKVSIGNESTDGIPVNSKLIRLDDKYIKGLKNSTILTEQNGIIVGGSIVEINKSAEKSANLPTALEITVAFKNIELIDKKEDTKKANNPQTHVEESYFNYKLFLKFSYSIKVKDVEKNKYLLDTLIETQKNTLFPSDYRYDTFGNKVNYLGDNNKPELDIDYNKNSKDLYANSKTILAPKCMNEAKEILTALFGYDEQLKYFTISRVKSKNPIFDVCDSALNIFNNVLDSISYNTKKEKHLNWHTAGIHVQANQVATIWENMITNEKILNEFKDPKDKEEYINKTKQNLIVAYLLEDEFETSSKLFYEVEPSTQLTMMGKTFPDDNMKMIINLLQREQILYKTHKPVFNFN